MKSEIRVILQEGSSNKAKGSCFEDLVRNILYSHHYDIRGNINFSGMEIDLVAEHKHKNETLYVECKAKEKVSSDEITKFCFNVQHRRADAGYFIRTSELEYQAGAILKEIKEDDRYKNLTFFEPGEVIQLLKDGKLVFEEDSIFVRNNISKRIMAVTYFGDYFIYLINEFNAFPTKFTVINANSVSKKIPTDSLKVLKERIDELENLDFIEYPELGEERLNNSNNEEPIETISEVQESDNWYDYLPASSEKKHFVGRDKIRTKIMQYLKKIHNGETLKRIFYLNGKSGWGKSSLVLEIKGRCKNVHYRNNFFALAIDTRSATSSNFVALALKKIVDQAITQKFIKDINAKAQFTSNYDLLSSPTMNSILNYLKGNNKYLVLIFDQFEDVFRKGDLFKSFYKFLSDVTDLRPNIILGFSWKSEIIIPIDHEAYHYWQQAKEQAKEFVIDEFGEKEIDGIILQLKESVGGLPISIENRIKESSQGLPWLTKKLCIHIYEQIISGIDKETLVESNLNIQNLFEKDEERVKGEELKALRLIARRAYDGNFFDETEVGEVLDSKTITSLLHKRLIIRSGANYNIYWDIFRDYLVTGEIPIIGESYLLRHMVNSCLDAFLLFEENRNAQTIEELARKHPKQIGEEGLYNLLIELRNIGLIQKSGDHYYLAEEVSPTKEFFRKYIINKFQNYTPYLKLKREGLRKITKDRVVQILKDTFKQDFQDITWNAYANTLISWIRFIDSDINPNIVIARDRKIKISKDDFKTALLRSSQNEITSVIPLLASDIDSIARKYYRDLYLLGLINVDREITDFAENLMKMELTDQVRELRKKAGQLPRMKQLAGVMSELEKTTANDMLESVPDNFFPGNAVSTKKVYAAMAMSWFR